MSEVSVMRSTTLGAQIFAAVLDTIDELDANRIAYAKIREKDDVVSLALAENGKFDPDKAAQNLLVCEVDKDLFNDFRREAIRSGIPIAWQTYVEPVKSQDELAKAHYFVVFPKTENLAMQKVIENFTKKAPYRDPLSMEEMVSWMRENESGSTVAASMEIDKNVYEFMNRNHMLTIPRVELGENEIDQTVRICVPTSMGVGVKETVKMAEALHTGEFRRVDEDRLAQRDSLLLEMLTNSKNNLHECVIADATMPSQYLKLTREGFELCIDTEDGPNVLLKRNRNEREFEQGLYESLTNFGGYKEFVGKEQDTMEKLHEFQHNGPELHGISVSERVYQLKREFIDELMQASEITGITYQQIQSQEQDKSRMKDDVIKMGNSLDEMSAQGLGNSAAAGDLRGDLAQIKGMILSPVAAESTKDLSDLYDVHGWNEFIENELYLNYRSPETKEKYLAMFKDMNETLAKEDRDVQYLFRQEFRETVHEVFDRDYRTMADDMVLEEVDLQHELYQSREEERSISYNR